MFVIQEPFTLFNYSFLLAFKGRLKICIHTLVAQVLFSITSNEEMEHLKQNYI